MVPLDGCMPHPFFSNEKKPRNFINSGPRNSGNLLTVDILDVHSPPICTTVILASNHMATQLIPTPIYWLWPWWEIRLQATSWRWCVPTNHCAAFEDPGPSERNGLGHHSPAGAWILFLAKNPMAEQVEMKYWQTYLGTYIYIIYIIYIYILYILYYIDSIYIYRYSICVEIHYFMILMLHFVTIHVWNFCRTTGFIGFTTDLHPLSLAHSAQENQFNWSWHQELLFPPRIKAQVQVKAEDIHFCNFHYPCKLNQASSPAVCG